MNDTPEQIAEEEVQAMVQLEKLIPKYCTAVNVTALSNRTVMMTLLFTESPGQISLIERVVIDRDHAISLSNILVKIVNDMEKQ